MTTSPSPNPYGPPAYPPVPPPYQAPPGQPTASNGFSITAMVVGIVGLVLFWVPGLNLLLGIVATTFGGLGIRGANRNPAASKGMAIAGLVMGVIAIIVAIVLLIAVIAAGSNSTT